MSPEDPKFSCPGCGKQYRWKPEMAGRTAKCGCGAKLVVPSAPPTAPSTPQKPDPPAVTTTKPAAAARCPSCGEDLASGAVLCINCGFNLKTGKSLAPVVVETSDDDEGHLDEKSPVEKLDDKS